VRVVTFSSPYFLLLLLLAPATLAVSLWLDRRRARYAVAFTNLDVLASVAPRRRRWYRWLPLALFLLAVGAAAGAVARPRATVSVPSQQATIVLLVDVSGSMRANDVKPSRLGAAQVAMDEFVDKVPKRVRVGLVSFSTEPDVLVAPTIDRGLMHEGLDELVPEAGTAIGDGIDVAARLAAASVAHAPRGKDGKLPAAVILLSDGAQTRGVLTPLQGAGRARTAGIRVFTIALGTNGGTLGLGPFGGYGYGYGGLGNPGGLRRALQPDPTTLRRIAELTGGVAFRAKSAANVQAVYRSLGSNIVRHSVRREVSSWFAGAAALLLLGAVGLGRLTGERLP
jgi:Ca-activated chloride channel family protein